MRKRNLNGASRRMVNTIKDDWRVGQPVWAAQGTVGWRPASIVRVGYKWIEVIFDSGKGSYGMRYPKDLRTRDPRLKGADKPELLKEDGDE